MSRDGGPALAVFAAAVFWSCRRCGAGPYTTDEDREVARVARGQVDEFCQSGAGLALGSRADLVAGAGGGNHLLSALREAESPADLQERAWGEITPSLVLQTIPVSMSAVVLLIWLVFCAGSLRPCRCWARFHATNRRTKAAAAVAVALLLVCIVASSAFSVVGYFTVRTGLENTACAFARLLHATLAGHREPPFAGMLSLLGELHEVDRTLDTGSEFLREVGAILRHTDRIQPSAALANQTLLLLRSMLRADANRRPRTALGRDLLHECRFCVLVVDFGLNPAISALAQSPGAALASARAEIEFQLSEERRAALQADLRREIDTLGGVKDFAVSNLAFLDTAGFRGQWDRYHRLYAPAVLLLILALIASATAVTVCGGCSAYEFMLHETTPGDAGDEGPGRYNLRVHQWARRAWCFGSCYGFIAFLVGGLLLVIAVPLSSFCLILDDADGEMLHDIAPALNISMHDDGTDQLASIVDVCLNPATPSHDVSMLDILHEVRDGRVVTLREKFLGTVESQIRQKLGAITENMAGTGNVTTSAEVLRLRTVLRSNDVDEILVPDEVEMRLDPRFADMAVDPRLRDGSGVVTGFRTSAACADHTVGPHLGHTSGRVVPGIDSLVERMRGLGTEVLSASCARKMICVREADDYNGNKACVAANNLIGLKLDLRSAGTYRCDLFADPVTSGYCDPLHMRKVEGSYRNDCVGADGTVRTKRRTCTLAEFVQYVRDFDQRIEKVLQRLEDTTAEEQPAIDRTMRASIDNFFLRPINDIARGATCSYASSYYQELLDGICYQGVWGLRLVAKCYVACAALVTLLAIVMYVVWRRALDNSDFGEPDEYEAIEARETDSSEELERESILGGTRVKPPMQGRRGEPL